MVRKTLITGLKYVRASRRCVGAVRQAAATTTLAAWGGATEAAATVAAGELRRKN